MGPMTSVKAGWVGGEEKGRLAVPASCCDGRWRGCRRGLETVDADVDDRS